MNTPADLAARAVDSKAAVVAPGHERLQTLPGAVHRAYPVRLLRSTVPRRVVSSQGGGKHER